MRLGKRIIKETKRSRFLNFLSKNLLYCILRLLFMTYRLRVVASKNHAQEVRGLYYFWHQHILCGMFFFFKSGLSGACVVSPSKDGQIAGFLCRKLGFHVLYGSAHKSSVAVVRQALSELQETGRLCLVGDGSRGPAYKLQRGAVYLAQKTQQPLVFVECNPQWAFTFKKSWDQFKLPLPFSKIFIVVHDPVWIGGLSNNVCEGSSS
jgi:lysophospholipid acyltransferase (LPLAT)-like uncharacterized protein